MHGGWDPRTESGGGESYVRASQTLYGSRTLSALATLGSPLTSGDEWPTIITREDDQTALVHARLLQSPRHISNPLVEGGHHSVIKLPVRVISAPGVQVAWRCSSMQYEHAACSMQYAVCSMQYAV
jgi:hypothetical protein